MKKWAYMSGAFILGVIVATTGDVAAAQVKSLVGQKVTGEYTIVVNNKTLSDKGAVIDSKTNVPVRALSDALGAKVIVSGKTIYITSETDVVEPLSSTEDTAAENKYAGRTKESLVKAKNSINNDILVQREKGKAEIEAQILELQGYGETPALVKKKEQLAEYEEAIKNAKEEIALIDEALSALEN